MNNKVYMELQEKFFNVCIFSQTAGRIYANINMMFMNFILQLAIHNSSLPTPQKQKFP